MQSQRTMFGVMQQVSVCPDCGGTGQVIKDKCPHCGGTLEFDATIQKMKCPYCDSEIDVEALQKNEELLSQSGAEDNMVWEETAGSEWEDGETDGMKVYTCNSCGGEIVGDYGSTAYFGSKSADWFMIPQFNTSPLESVYRLVVDGNNFPQLGNSQYHLIPIEEGGGIYVTSQCTKDVKVLAKPCVYQNTFAATNYFVNESSGHTLSLNNGLANAVFNAAKFCNPVFRFGGCGNISFGGGMPACNNFPMYVSDA